MNEDQEKLNELLSRRENPGGPALTPEEEQWLADLTARYPFFTLPDALREAQQGEAPSLREMVSGPAPEAAARLHGVEEASRFDGFYPPADLPKAPTTEAAIDDFLNTWGHQSAEEDELLERLIFNPVADYSQQLAREEEVSLPAAPAADIDSRDARLNRFILTHHPGSRHQEEQPAPKTPENSPDSQPTPPPASPSASQSKSQPTPPKSQPTSQTPPPIPGKGALLSESLAKIYIKTHRYEQAYEILNDLSLRFPEKSAYFADQLRFLRKLVLNQQRLRLENQK